MPVKTFQVLSDNPNNDQVLHIFNHPHQLLVKLHLFVIFCSFMLVNKKTVLNENRASCMFDRPKRAAIKFGSIG